MEGYEASFLDVLLSRVAKVTQDLIGDKVYMCVQILWSLFLSLLLERCQLFKDGGRFHVDGAIGFSLPLKGSLSRQVSAIQGFTTIGKCTLNTEYLCLCSKQKAGRCWVVKVVLKSIDIPKHTHCVQTSNHTYTSVCRLLRIMFSRCLSLALGTFLSLVDFELEAAPMPVLLKSNRHNLLIISFALSLEKLLNFGMAGLGFELSNN